MTKISKTELENRVKKLNGWLQNHPETHYLYNEYKKECVDYTNALVEADMYQLEAVYLDVKTQYINFI